MKTNLIIGAGQLGSRHLQGLLKCDTYQQKIFVLDPSTDSLKTAKIRAGEIKHNHEIEFTTNWEILPKEFDLVIIATNADIREEVVTKLLLCYRIKFLILEKVLFQCIDSLQRVADLFNKNHVKAWVNHPRRMFQSYIELKKQLSFGHPKNFYVTGGNWGLGCNALHFIDLFVFLSGAQVRSIHTEWIDPTILKSKREGFAEFTGSISGKLDDGSTFQISSLKGNISGVTIAIFGNTDRVIIQESGTPQILTMKNENQFKPEFYQFTMEFQNGLTATLANDLFSRETCNLPTYSEAMHTHEIFITSLLQKYNAITGLNSNVLPIT